MYRVRPTLLPSSLHLQSQHILAAHSSAAIAVAARPSAAAATFSRLRTPAAAAPYNRPYHASAVQYAHSTAATSTQEEEHSLMSVPFDSLSSRPSSAVSSPSAAAAAPSLPRPGTPPAPQAARVPYRPRKPLSPRMQSLIDSQLIDLRRKEHPEWLEKQTVRKMTLLERQKLLTATHQRFDLETLNGFLKRCRSPLASLQYVDRAHDWFVRVYNHAPLGTYHQMMRAASRFQQYLRVDEYFKLLLRFHQPVPETFNILLAAHAQAGHTKRVLEILEQMQQGSTELIKKHIPAKVLKLQQGQQALQLTQSSSNSTEEQSTSDSSSSSSTSPLAPTSSTTPAPPLRDPTIPGVKLARKLASHANFKFPFTERALYHLLQCHAANNDTEAILQATSQLKEQRPFYPTQNHTLQLTIPIAELLMHYFALHRLLPQSIELLNWIEAARLPLTVHTAWTFFDGFKREVAMRRLQSESGHEHKVRDELERRARRTPPEAPITPEEMAERQAANQPQTKKEDEFDPTALPIPSTPPRALAPFPHQGHPHAYAPMIRSPFPKSVEPNTMPAPHLRIFPQAPLRKQARQLTPSPLDRLKEDWVPFQETLRLLVLEHGFVPTPKLFNAYLSYYADNFYPVGRFPDVMRKQTRMLEEVADEAGVQQAKQRWAELHSEEAAETDLPSSSLLRSRTFTPFVPTADTYALLIQSLLDRKPLKASHPSSFALDPPQPSQHDQNLIMHLRQEMKQRGVAPSLQVKIQLMQLMVYQERWMDLYTSFTLLWKGEKMRRDHKLIEMRSGRKPEQIMEEMLKEEEQEEKEAQRERKEAAQATAAIQTDADGSELPPPPAYSSLHSSYTHFSCMSLLPIFISLSHRPSLDRLNLFFGIVSRTRDFPLTLPFIQGALLNPLADRGLTNECIELLKGIKKRYGLQPTLTQYNSLLASIITDTYVPPAAIPDSEDGQITSVGTSNPKDGHSTMLALFQTWELMKLLHLGHNQQTLTILLTGCLRSGQLLDGQRLWRWIQLRSPWRPNREMYTVYVEFLLKHHQLSAALYTLRSQSFKDGLDWSLKECYMLLEYIEKHLLKHASGRSAQQLAADVEQQEGAQRSSSSSSAVTDKLAAEIEGEEMDEDELGATSTTSSTSSTSVHIPTPEQTQLYQSILQSAQQLSLRLLDLEKRGGQLGQRGRMEVVPASRIGRMPEALEQHRRHTSPYARVTRMTPDEKEEDGVLRLTSIPGRLFHPYMVPLLDRVEKFTGEAIKRLKRFKKKEGIKLLVEAEQKQVEEWEQKIQQEVNTQLDEIAALTDEMLQQSGMEINKLQIALTDEEPAMEDMQNAVPKKKDASTTESISSSADSASSSKPARPSKKAKKPVEEVDLASLFPAGEYTPVTHAVVHTLTALEGKADKTRLPQVQVPEPSHPVLLDGVDLCALRAEDKLSKLTIPQLKEIQTHPQLMQQQQHLVKGIKSHHLQVVDTWLQQCSCAKHSK